MFYNIFIIKGLPHEVKGPKNCGLWTGARLCPPHKPICCHGHCDITDHKCRPPGLSYVTKRVEITNFFHLGCLLFFNDKKHLKKISQAQNTIIFKSFLHIFWIFGQAMYMNLILINQALGIGLTVIHIKASSSGIFLLKDGKKQTVVLILHNYNTAGCISDDECIYPKICVDGKCIVVGMSHNIQRELKQSVSVVCLLPPVQFLVRVQQRQ